MPIMTFYCAKDTLKKAMYNILDYEQVEINIAVTLFCI